MMTVSMDTPVGMAAWMLDHDADSHEKISRAFLDGQPSEALRQRDRGQHDVVQADEHRDLVGTAVLGGEPSSASLERVRAEAPELWLPVAFTSRSCSLKRCEPDSGHSASAGLVVSSTAQTGTDIRPSTSAFRKRNWQPPSTHRGDALARSGDGCIARRAVGDDPGTGRLLGHGLRLAQFRRALRCYSSSGKQTGTTCTALSLLWPGRPIELTRFRVEPDCLLVDVIQDPDAVNGLIVRSWGERAFPHSVDNGWTSVVAKFQYLAGRCRAVLAGRSLDPARRRR
jgi:hypothetical protein